MSEIEDLVIEVDTDTDEQPLPANVDEGAYVHAVIAGQLVLVPARAYRLPVEARENFNRGVPKPLSTLPNELRRKVLDALKGPEAEWKAHNKPYQNWIY
jgi:hypothetical protein